MTEHLTFASREDVLRHFRRKYANFEQNKAAEKAE